MPLDCFRYEFMRYALLAVCLAAPLFALLGTAVINNRMTFFSEVLGHSALTGIAIGVLLGIKDPIISMAAFAVLMTLGINFFKGATHATSDTVLGVFLAFTVALGIVILSRGGGFAKYSGYLIGDILTVSLKDIAAIIVMFAAVLLYWVFFGNALLLLSINQSLARSRGVNVFMVEAGFTVLLALVVMFSVKLVGILIINSLLVLPAAAARNLARNLASYTAWALLISLFSGIAGLMLSYYWGTAAGATIVLVAVLCYALSALVGISRK